MRNRIGVCEWYLSTSGPSSIKMAALMGFDGIQLSDLGGAEKKYPMTDRRIQEQYLEVAEEYGMVLQAYYSSSLTNQGGIKHPSNSTEAKECLINFSKGVEICYSLKIPNIMVASFQNSEFRNDYEMKNTAEMLKKFVEISQDKGIQVMYESFTTTERLVWILEYVGPRLKICYDTLNPIRFGFSNPSSEINTIGIDLIECVHAKDSPENMIGSCTLGTGAGRFFETMDILKVSGYEGWYMAENYFYLPPMNEYGHGWDNAVKDLEILRKITG